MLSKRLPSILPDMTWEESLEVTQLYSVMGLLDPEDPLVRQRPFRSPHHTVSNAGLAGGGSNPKPGEISLAHNGVLFLDELPEFTRDTLDLMRQPLEDGRVTISRAMGSISYPAEFMLVCAMNPCKCGWYGDPSGKCTCSEQSVLNYRSRISGPLLDRIDIIVEVPAVQFEDLRRRREAEPSEAVKERVNKARKLQHRRYGEQGGMCNARMGPGELRSFCRLDVESAELLKQANNGIYIDFLTGLHAGANAVTGDFSLQSGGYRIENGSLAERISAFTVAGNFYELLMNITALANNMTLPRAMGKTTFGAPSTRVDGLSIAGK